MVSLDFSLSAFRVLITPLLAALSIIEKAFDKFSAEGVDFITSIADLALVFVARLNAVFFLSALNFLIADLVIGMGSILL